MDPLITLQQVRCAWVGDELKRTGSHVYNLDADRVDRLAIDLPTFLYPLDKADPGSFRDRIGDKCLDIATGIRERLGPSGPGLVILGGDGIDRLSNFRLETLLFCISVLLGRPMMQNSKNEVIVSVRDTRPANVETERGYLSNSPMLMHTDPTDVAALLCINPSSCGGTNLFCSAEMIHDVISLEAPTEIQNYYREWTWDLRGYQAPGAIPYVMSPIFRVTNGKLSCRYGSLMLREGARATNSHMTEAIKLLDLFEEIAQRPSLTLRHSLRRGESVWIDNNRILHGREAFQDANGKDKGRHLLRTWLWWENRPEHVPLPDEFTAAIDWRKMC